MSVGLRVGLGRISSEISERVWLKFCPGTEVCPEHCVSHFGGNRPRGPARGAENVVFLRPVYSDATQLDVELSCVDGLL